MKFNSGIAAAIVLSFALAGLTACERKGSAERAGEKIDDTAKNVGEKMENAGEKVRARAAKSPGELDVQEIARALRDFDSLTRKALAAALAVHDSVVETLAEGKTRDVHP